MDYINKKTQKHQSSINPREGFTIVELLIVIVVIGILAAISIVAYNGIQNRSNDAAVKNDLTQMAKKVALYNAEESTYPSFTWFFNNINISKSSYSTSSYNLYYCTTDTYSDFGIAARSTSGQTFTISSTSGLREANYSPSHFSSCGAIGQEAFGETWERPDYKPNNIGIRMDYGYHHGNGVWRYNL